ncbi:Protein N-lysine methyltransferase METTL21A isoform X1 [Phytophthora megakarya]|uniref:Protein N-lysine methyltransferase METTL21A isoform X1 n=1 Tax=Phytophthora megakarya TaxID=4795 RepID=A0A225X1K9_9STRA|nr:Protein N-lysine methyltransferase METTL21A isoform X1 [Phytophthora megakarya]
MSESLWGRTEEKQFLYVVTVPGTTQQVSLTAVQDREICAGTPAFPSHGHCVWDAALLLADYLQTQASDNTIKFHGKKVVELGAGVGLVGMTLAVLGARVVLTDQEYALPLLRKNVAVNFENKAVVPTVEECQWGESCKTEGLLATWKKNTDVVVFSDVLYHASAFLLLIKTLHELVSPTTDVFFSFETRNAAIEGNFLEELGKSFDVDEVSRKHNPQVFASFEYPDELFIYHAQLKVDNEN